MGETRNGSIFASKINLVVERVRADDSGGFQLEFSNNYTLSVFPASATQMEWLFSRTAGTNLALIGGSLCGSPRGV